METIKNQWKCLTAYKNATLNHVLGSLEREEEKLKIFNLLGAIFHINYKLSQF